MDKSFNDQELSDIMKEIEALEDNFTSEEEKLETSPVMEELAELEEVESVPVAAKPKKAVSSVQSSQVLPLSSKTKSSGTAPTTMSFKVSGDLQLDLQFDVGGKVVCLEVNEEGLYIQMDGGVTFSIPLKKTA